MLAPPVMPSLAAAVLVAALTATPALAQHRTFADVAPKLDVGAPVRLVIDGARVDAWVRQASADGLVVSRGAPTEAIQVPLDRLEQISYDDGVANGALLGAAVGAAPGVYVGMLVRMLCDNEGANCDAAPYIMGGFTAAVGLALGIGIDEAIRTTVRFAPARTTARVSLAADPRRPAATLSIRF